MNQYILEATAREAVTVFANNASELWAALQDSGKGDAINRYVIETIFDPQENKLFAKSLAGFKLASTGDYTPSTTPTKSYNLTNGAFVEIVDQPVIDIRSTVVAENVTVQNVIDALDDLLDGYDYYDIVSATGMSQEKAERIIEIRNSLRAK